MTVIVTCCEERQRLMHAMSALHSVLSSAFAAHANVLMKQFIVGRTDEC